MPSRKDCPVLQILDVDYPNADRKNGEILISLSDGSGQYSVTLSRKGVVEPLAEKKCTEEGVYSFAGLVKGEYTLSVHDCVNVHCQPVEKVVVLGVREPVCHDDSDCHSKKGNPCHSKKDPCHVDEGPNHYGDLCVHLHKVVQPTCKRLGSLAVRVSGGRAPYQITFKGPVSKTISADRAGVYGSNNLPAGEYWVSVTDGAQDCERVEARLCQVTSPLLVNTSTLCNPTCSNDGSFQVNLCTGVAPFKIFVTGPVNSTRYVDQDDSRCQTFEYLPAGNYSVTIIDGEHQVEETCVYLEAVIHPMKLTAYKYLDIICNKPGKINYVIEGGHYPFIVELLRNGDVVESRCVNAEDSKTKAAHVKGCFDIWTASDFYQIHVRDGCCQEKTSTTISVQEPDPGFRLKATVTDVACGDCGPVATVCLQARTTNDTVPIECLYPLNFQIEVDCGEDGSEGEVSRTIVCASGPVDQSKWTFNNLPPNKICIADPEIQIPPAEGYPETNYWAAVESTFCKNAGLYFSVVEPVTPHAKYIDDLELEVCKIVPPMQGACNGYAYVKIKGGCGPYTLTWESACGGERKCVVDGPCGTITKIDHIGVNLPVVDPCPAEEPEEPEGEQRGNRRETVEPQTGPVHVRARDIVRTECEVCFEVTETDREDDLCVFDVRTLADTTNCDESPDGRAEICLTGSGSPIELKDVRLTYYGRVNFFDLNKTCAVIDHSICQTSDDINDHPSDDFGAPSETPWESWVRPGPFNVSLFNPMTSLPLTFVLNGEFNLIRNCDDKYEVTITRKVGECCPDGGREVTFTCRDEGKTVPIWVNIKDTCNGQCYRVERSVIVTARGDTCECLPLPGPKHTGKIGKCHPGETPPCDEPEIGDRRYLEVGCLRNGLWRVIIIDQLDRQAQRYFYVGSGSLNDSPPAAGADETADAEKPNEECAQPSALVVGEPVFHQPTCTYNGSIGFEIESAHYPVLATLHARGFKKTICLEAPVTSANANANRDGHEDCPPCEDVSGPTPTDITFLNLGPGCYTVEIVDTWDHRIEFPNLLLSSCKTPLEVDGQLDGRQYTVTYAGGNGKLLVFLSGPVCRKWLFDSVDCEAGSVSQVLTGDDGEPLELEDGHYSVSVTDECNQNVTLHFKVPVDLEGPAPGKGCCPEVPKGCIKGAKGPFDVFLLKVDDC